jgi:hypothetical protein
MLGITAIFAIAFPVCDYAIITDYAHDVMSSIFKNALLGGGLPVV